MPVKIALPKGRLLAETSILLEQAGWGLEGYHEGLRNYHIKSRRFPGIQTKVFHEKDIPIQVAIGNYDLGICGLDWGEELLAKYPSSSLVKLRDLGYGRGALYVVASRSGPATMEKVLARSGTVRLASEYPNLAESFALNQRLRRFSVFPLWGAADAYPPESADLALLAGNENQQTFNHDLVTVKKALGFSAFLIANRDSWQAKDLSAFLSSVDSSLTAVDSLAIAADEPSSPSSPVPPDVSRWCDSSIVRLALPDGHQQKPTIELLQQAGIRMEDYPSPHGNRRPGSSLEGVASKVIRPQDMPLQVANGNFDLAITGQDWLREHLYQFPSSPVTELVGLGFGKVRIVAVVHNGVPADDIKSVQQFFTGMAARVRVTSEYVNIADKYARDHRLGLYRVIPSWGASEAFLPDDADLLIENTETGSTIARHNLKIIDTLFESTACLIGNKDSIQQPARGERMKKIAELLRAAVQGTK